VWWCVRSGALLPETILDCEAEPNGLDASVFTSTTHPTKSIAYRAFISKKLLEHRVIHINFHMANMEATKSIPMMESLGGPCMAIFVLVVLLQRFARAALSSCSPKPNPQGPESTYVLGAEMRFCVGLDNIIYKVVEPSKTGSLQLFPTPRCVPERRSCQTSHIHHTCGRTACLRMTHAWLTGGLERNNGSERQTRHRNPKTL
jgi:hypothetical protein